MNGRKRFTLAGLIVAALVGAFGMVLLAVVAFYVVAMTSLGSAK